MRLPSPTSGFPAWRSDKGTGNPQDSDLEGQWDLTVSLPWDCRKQIPVLECAPGPRGKEQRPHRRHKQNYLLVLEGLLQTVGQQGLHWRGALAAAVQEGPTWHKPTWRSPLIQGWVRPNNYQGGMQPHPPVDNCTKALPEQGPAHHSKTQFFPSPVPPIKKPLSL